MKAIIIGGGIAGLSTAIALERVGITCQVYEAAPVIREVGAGIWMASNAMQILSELGIAEQVMAKGNVLQRLSIADRNLKTINFTDLNHYAKTFGFRTTAIHRGRLQRVLLDQLRPSQVHAGKRFQRFTTAHDQVQAHFEDGSMAEGDVLLAADGLRSAVRRQLFPEARLRYAGQTCWRGIASLTLPAALQHQSFECWGQQLRFGFSAIAPGEVYWYAVAKAPEGERDTSPDLARQLADTFAGFAAPMPQMIAATPPENIIRGDLHDLVRLPSWQQDRILLLGDAAHAATPNMGQGGCQAVEDAWYLARAFSRHPNPEAAFAEFETSRRERVDYVVNTSWRIGKIAHISFAQGLRNWLFRQTPPRMASKMLHKLYTVAK